MKCLFLEAWNFVTEEIGAVYPEANCSDCLVVLVTIETGDNEKQIKKMIKEIYRVSLSMGFVVLAPFCHLSSKLMNYEDAEKFFYACAQQLKFGGNLRVSVSKFGADKSLMLDIKSGKNSIKFREF